jgi:hypothetical protein
VTRLATVSARERASVSTSASEPRGVPAATSPSGRWANTQGGGNGQAGGCRGGSSDQEPEGLDGCFRGLIYVLRDVLESNIQNR